MNIFELGDIAHFDEILEKLVENEHIRIERIISTGQETDWYDQEEHEYVILVQGEATVEYEGKRLLHIKTGDTVLIKPHERHRVAKTSVDPPCIWICVFW